MTNPPMETLTGEIYEIIYQNEENGYTVCVVEVNNALVTVRGNMPFIVPGEQVNIEGFWDNHPDYGEQFSVTSIERALPRKVSAILAYLSSGIVSGIREATAKKIINKFGEDTLEIIATEPERLAEIKGISKSRAIKISESFLIHQYASETIMFLQQYGISTNLALRVYKIFGSRSIEQIKENPYILCESVDRIGFKTADRIAGEMNTPKNHPSRISGGITHTLEYATLSGHTCLKKDDLTYATAELLGCDITDIEASLLLMRNNGKVIFENEFVYLPRYYSTEIVCAQKLSELMLPTMSYSSDIEGDIARQSERNSIELSSMQKEAVSKALGGGVLIITGGPGTGKTTIMKIILDIFESHEYKIALCAPTGKAAKRLSEACNFSAKTLHRLLEVEFSSNLEQVFGRNQYNPIDADVVIVDEMSMVDILLFGALLKALKRGTCLIMAGDSDQLPSVGAGNVLRDMLDSGVIPSVRLNEVFRQAEKSRIVMNAHRINMGEMPLENDRDTDFFFMPRNPEGALATICELCSGRLGKAYGFDSISDIQVLSPSRKGIVGTANLNKVLQAKLNPPSKEKKEKAFGERIFRVGDKVIQTRNNYDMLWSLPDGSADGFGIFNGDIGTVIDILPKSKSMRILFDDSKIVEYEFSAVEDLDIAYALTVHKSQGSEWSAVIIPVCSFPQMLMTRNLLYTAVTRGKKLVILVGSSESVSRMVRNNKLQERYTLFRKRLMEAIGND